MRSFRPVFITLALLPLAGNWPVVSGWLTTDPVYYQSGLGSGLSGGVLPGLTAFDPNIGITTQAFGRLAADEWLSGHIPWWNPYSGVGLPLAAEGQNQALFLPFVLLLALRNGPLLIMLALQEVAAFATYGLLRTLRLTRTAAWIGAALFALNGTFAWFGHGPIMPIAFLPLALLGIEIIWQDGRYRSRYGVAVTAVAIALSLYAGFPETAYIDGLLCAVWAMVRLPRCASGHRLAYLSRLAVAALIGLLLAAPYIVPFMQLLSVGDIGMHNAGANTIATPPAALPLLFMPYALGPPGGGSGDPSGVLLWLWAVLGGYVSVPVVVLAIAALVSAGKPVRGLRWSLAIWCLAMIGTSFGAPVIARVIYAVPMLVQTQVFRYAAPSWELAAIILGAMAIDDWQRGRLAVRHVTIAMAVMFGCAVAAIAVAAPSIAYLRESQRAYGVWLTVCVAWATAGLLAIAILLASPPNRRRGFVLAGVLAADAVLMFSEPRLTGFRHASLNTGSIGYLRTHLGLQRFYSLAGLRANYAAFFQVASINSDTLPTPRTWSRYIQTALDANTDPNAFNGDYQFPGLPRRDHVEQFIEHLAAYQALGVRYVLVPRGMSLSPTVRTPVSAVGGTPAPLRTGDSLEVELPGAAVTQGAIDRVSVFIGTYLMTSDGTLAVSACAGGRCVTGSAGLAGAADNAGFEIALDSPLEVAAGETVELRFTHTGGTVPVAIWDFPRDGGVGRMPSVAIVYRSPDMRFGRVYQDRAVTIYEVTGAAPYFDVTGGPCRLSATVRDEVTSVCEAPARLIRRELYYDGWTAAVDGQRVPISVADGIFQAVDVPAGTTTVRFRYAPPYANAIGTAFGLGLLSLLALLAWRGNVRGHSAAGAEP
jgi:hypothetical protein